MSLAAALEKQVTTRLRERGLVVWLDKDGHYSAFVDRLSERGDFFAPIVAFRGSFLETLLALESLGDGLDPTPLLIHVPGHNDVTIRKTPLLEAYKAGTRYERAFDTLIREVAAGRVPPEETESFLTRGENTLDEAERWLEGFGPGGTGFETYLNGLPPDWVLDGLVRSPSDLTARIVGEAERESLRAYLGRHTGLSSEFQQFFLHEVPLRTVRSLTEAWMGWLLAVEYVNDLTRAPHMAELRSLAGLSAPLRKNSLELVAKLRKQFPDEYREYAMQTEALLEAELQAGTAEELGKIDTFSREDTRLQEAAIACLREENWGQAVAWSKARLEAPSVWVSNDLFRRHEWSLVLTAAHLGKSVAERKQPLRSARSLEDALLAYTESAYEVDRAHRHFEQERMQLLTPLLPHYQELEKGCSLVRRRYREWLDELTGAFSDLCSREGFLPPPHLQQRQFYDQVVHPMTQAADARVAFFMVDALRFEMAAELAEQLDGQVRLQARYSELPSITSVGMNVLAPVSRDGNLTLDNKPFSGFRAGNYAVRTPDHRVKAMGDRSLERLSGTRRSPLLLSLAAVSNSSPEKLAKQVKGAALIVVHSREIDGSGESDVGLATYDRWLGQLRSAVQHLRNAGVEEFVVASDHGFLLLDDSREPVVYNSGEIDRRFVLTDSPIREESMATVALRSLNYLGTDGYLMFLRDSRVFKSKGKSATTFVHGGNSLQERVIPVLTVNYRSGRSRKLAHYRLKARVEPPIMGCSRLRVLLEDDSDGVFGFAVPPVLPIAMRVPGLEIEVVIQDVQGARLVNQQLQLQLGEEAEVFFKLQGGGATRAPVEFYHPDATENVQPLTTPELFDVVGPVSAPEPPQALSWVDKFDEPALARVFQHIETFGSIEEGEVRSMLSRSQMRRFTLEWESFMCYLPFDICIDTGGASKRYRKT